jgi:hypothetical protein
VTAAFTYQAPARRVRGATRSIAIRLARHPSNRESAAIMGLAGYRGIDRARNGEAVVRFERFGRDPDELRRRLVDELRLVTTVRILPG